MASEDDKSDRHTLDDLSGSDLHFISHCIVYTLCCMHGLVEEALNSYEEAKVEIGNLGRDGINDLQKKIIASAGVEFNEDNVYMVKHDETKPQLVMGSKNSKIIQ